MPKLKWEEEIYPSAGGAAGVGRKIKGRQQRPEGKYFWGRQKEAPWFRLREYQGKGSA